MPKYILLKIKTINNSEHFLLHYQIYKLHPFDHNLFQHIKITQYFKYPCKKEKKYNDDYI